ncbi:MAG: hypothetical protein PUH57_04000 [Prevotellaceae bacterium]|nr:hypothetical protein [Prevotellaceae bacterium]MDY2749983.1 hypothetical protein [Prevotella sp.]
MTFAELPSSVLLCHDAVACLSPSLVTGVVKGMAGLCRGRSLRLA